MFFFGKSDIGRKRSSNQDCFYTMRLAESVVLCVVCDGMGGANGGNIASDLAARQFVRIVEDNIAPLLPGAKPLDTSEAATMEFSLNDRSTPIDCADAAPIALLRRAAEAANTAVWRRAKEDPALRGMGTTLVATLFIGDKLYAVNVGDSRLYLISDTEMTQLSHDHSYVQYLIDIGKLSPEDAEISPHKNIITRAIGIGDTVEIDSFCVDLEADQKPCHFLLCSDGLSNYLPEDEIFSIISGDTTDVPPGKLTVITGDSDPLFCALVKELESKAETMVKRANDNGGGDNITLVLLKYLPFCQEKALPTDDFAAMRMSGRCSVSDDGLLPADGKILGTAEDIAKEAPEEPTVIPEEFTDLTDAMAEQAQRSGQTVVPSYEISVDDFAKRFKK